MPICNVEQPERIQIDKSLRLRKYDGRFAFALPWYQDLEILMLVDGKQEPYDLERLQRMYAYLEAQGECYVIEWQDGDVFRPVGDVTFWREDMPIVIGEKNLWGRGIGTRVVRALIQRGRTLGFDCLMVDEIYDFNLGSQKLFTRLGFSACGETPRGKRYRLELA